MRYNLSLWSYKTFWTYNKWMMRSDKKSVITDKRGFIKPHFHFPRSFQLSCRSIRFNFFLTHYLINLKEDDSILLVNYWKYGFILRNTQQSPCKDPYYYVAYVIVFLFVGVRSVTYLHIIRFTLLLTAYLYVHLSRSRKVSFWKM